MPSLDYLKTLLGSSNYVPGQQLSNTSRQTPWAPNPAVHGFAKTGEAMPPELAAGAPPPPTGDGGFVGYPTDPVGPWTPKYLGPPTPAPGAPPSGLARLKPLRPSAPRELTGFGA